MTTIKINFPVDISIGQTVYIINKKKYLQNPTTYQTGKITEIKLSMQRKNSVRISLSITTENHHTYEFTKDDINDRLFFDEAAVKSVIDANKKTTTVIIDDTNVTLNKNGVNSEIKAHILPDAEMRKLGFTDFNNANWCYSAIIPSIDKHDADWQVSFYVSIPKNGDDISIDILDDNFCQPYDYQSILKNEPNFIPAKHVFEKVEFHMDKLQKAGVLSGHIYGRYI